MPHAKHCKDQFWTHTLQGQSLDRLYCYQDYLRLHRGLACCVQLSLYSSLLRDACGRWLCVRAAHPAAGSDRKRLCGAPSLPPLNLTLMGLSMYFPKSRIDSRRDYDGSAAHTHTHVCCCSGAASSHPVWLPTLQHHSHPLSRLTHLTHLSCSRLSRLSRLFLILLVCQSITSHTLSPLPSSRSPLGLSSSCSACHRSHPLRLKDPPRVPSLQVCVRHAAATVTPPGRTITSNPHPSL